ncbi:hypothetical protein [Kibdelosporangium philippinense]|uniref:hypothetical protein n=1 Tax=Kibdelosporangium philippinense TaxID=211113 RepID=UPI00361B63E8
MPCRCPDVRVASGKRRKRLGRLLRRRATAPAHFYSVSPVTPSHRIPAHRQRFLAEQGYAYTIMDADDLLGPPVPEIG